MFTLIETLHDYVFLMTIKYTITFELTAPLIHCHIPGRSHFQKNCSKSYGYLSIEWSDWKVEYILLFSFNSRDFHIVIKPWKNKDFYGKRVFVNRVQSWVDFPFLLASGFSHCQKTLAKFWVSIKRSYWVVLCWYSLYTFLFNMF